VTRKLPASAFKFNSWAYSTKSELHWQDMKRHKQDTDGSAARFFVRLDGDGMTSGFMVSHKTGEAGAASDWDRFVEWIDGAGNQDFVQSLTDTHDLSMERSDSRLEISRRIDKEKAVAREKAIAGDIAELFAAMTPLYQAAVAS
jgi:hypothetical protein